MSRLQNDYIDFMENYDQIKHVDVYLAEKWLKMALKYEKRLEISPYGDDKIDELESALDFIKPQLERKEGVITGLQDENRKMRYAMNEFCDRVERGEIQSQNTYAKFKEILRRE